MNNVVDSSVKTVISTGKMEDFFTMLHEYDSIRTSDCLIKNQKSVDIHITRNKGRIGNWVMTENLSDFSSKRRKKTGKTMKSFYQYFSGEKMEIGIGIQKGLELQLKLQPGNQSARRMKKKRCMMEFLN